jgi:hypothetical protein
MNTQKHSVIGCAPVELLFRDCTPYLDWLNQQRRVDPAVGVAQEDPSRAPIFDPSPSTPVANHAIKIGVSSGNSRTTMLNSSETGVRSESNARISPPIQSYPACEPKEVQEPRFATVIEKVLEETKKMKRRTMRKYSKKHNIQHFIIGDIVSIKVPRAD